MQRGEKFSHPFVILDDVLADAGQRRPLAVVDGFDGAALVRFELAHLAAQAVGSDTCRDVSRGTRREKRKQHTKNIKQAQEKEVDALSGIRSHHRSIP